MLLQEQETLTTMTLGGYVPTFTFDGQTLQALAALHHESYIQADPFPHIVLDNLFPEAVLDMILEEFPEPDRIDWLRFENGEEKKLATTHELQVGHFTRHFLYLLNSSVFLSFLEHLTGIYGLIPDPHLLGGGLHQIERGGYLGIHADFNWHERLKLDRRINLLLYLNKDWDESDGGHLELWDTGMKTCVKRLLPVFNRCVIFSTTSTSYHGHPIPLSCPEGKTRKSIAMYYYSNGRPAGEINVPHSTLFQQRPQ